MHLTDGSSVMRSVQIETQILNVLMRKVKIHIYKSRKVLETQFDVRRTQMKNQKLSRIPNISVTEAEKERNLLPVGKATISRS